MKPKDGKNSKKNNSNRIRTYIFVGLLIIIGLFAFSSFNSSETLEEIPVSTAIARANSGDFKSFTLIGERIEITPNGQDEPSLFAIVNQRISLQEQGLEDGKVEVANEATDNSSQNLFNAASLIIPMFIIVFIFMMFRSAQGQGNQAMSFGKSKARLYGNEKDKVSFKDIAGNVNAKEDLEEVVDFLKNPKKFLDVGAKIPKGVLLVGEPGTGKTMIARAVAGEAQVPFFSISGSEFVEMFVGVGASRVRDLFSKAKKNSPCIIFIDEIDAVGRKRGSGMGGGHDEREQTLNQILVEMDGFEKGQNVIVLAATNRADVLDPALLRPGRFDRRTNIELPDREDREAILKIHFKGKPVDKGVDLNSLAAKTAGSSGADLANIANEAAIKSARRNSKSISNADVVGAFEKVAIGPERRGKIMTEKNKEMTAYHEAGHALVGHVLEDSDNVHKVTIVSRGHAGGVTWFIPAEDVVYRSIHEYKDILARTLGGRVAEKIVYGPEAVTTGAGSDLQMASAMARDMVINQGMGSKELRDIVFQTEEGLMFDKMVHDRSYSDDTAKRIDEEIQSLIKEAAHRAEVVIKANMKFLESLKAQLLKKETVEAKEVLKIFTGTKTPAAAKIKK